MSSDLSESSESKSGPREAVVVLAKSSAGSYPGSILSFGGPISSSPPTRKVAAEAGRSGGGKSARPAAKAAAAWGPREGSGDTPFSGRPRQKRRDRPAGCGARLRRALLARASGAASVSHVPHPPLHQSIPPFIRQPTHRPTQLPACPSAFHGANPSRTELPRAIAHIVRASST